MIAWSSANVLTLGSYSLSEMAQLRGKKAAAQQWATLHMMVIFYFCGLVTEWHPRDCVHACVYAKSLQLCLTHYLMGCSPPGSSILGILQARKLEWVAMPSSRELPDPGIEPVSLASPALAGRFFTTSASWEATPVAGYINTWLDNWHSVWPCLAWSNLSNLKQLPSLQGSC